MPLSRCFETGRRSLTQSSVEAFVSETANGCLVLHRAGTIAERQKPRAEELEKTFHALEGRAKSFFKFFRSRFLPLGDCSCSMQNQTSICCLRHEGLHRRLS